MRRFLEPESVAIIGVPRQTGQGSYNNLEVMCRYGYRGRIYPINPNAKEIYGIKAYSSTLALPEVPDLAVISVSRERVLTAVQDCGEFGIKRAIIITQGFSDADRKGAEMQDEIIQLANRKGIRVIGPNTMGIINNYHHFTTAFLNNPFPEKFAPVSIIAQTGLLQMSSEGMFSFESWGKCIDIGNGSDFDHVDSMQLLADDPETKVIVVHIEGLRRGKEFLEIASQVTRTKPIIVFKTGRSLAGARAALSHSGSMVGEDDIADAAFRRAGIIRVRKASEMKNAIHALLYLPEMKGPRIGILSVTGAGGIMAADEAEEHGLELGKVPESLKRNLTEGLPEWIKARNPMDFWPLGMVKGNYEQVYSLALSGLMEASGIDGILTINKKQFIQAVKNRSVGRKPLVVWTLDDTKLAGHDETENTAYFETIESGVAGLAYSYKKYLSRIRTEPSQKDFDIDEKKMEYYVCKAKAEKVLLGKDALEMLSAFGIPICKNEKARNWKEVLNASEVIGFPLVLKISGKNFIHKTEMGAVMTSIESKAELHRAYNSLKNRIAHQVNSDDFEFIVQKQVNGKEILIGLKKDPQFGKVILCGAGGIYTEVLKDTSKELVPVDNSIARMMLESLNIYPLLKGSRGERSVCLKELTDIIERISYLAERVPDISELDINPVIVNSESCVAVDARIIF